MTPTGSATSRKRGVSIWIDMPRCRLTFILLPVALAVFHSSTSAIADEARILQLKHRTAEELVPVIRPLLGPDDALSGMGYRLIVRTPEKNLKEIERVLGQLDIAPRRLQITVQQTVADDSTATSQSVSGEARLGDKARITLPATPTDDRGLVVQKDDLRYSAGRRATTAGHANIQTVTTVDGQRAYIRIGQSVPHVKKILALNRNQMVIAQGIELQNVTTGFDVRPRVRGDRVQIEITPRLSTLKNPSTGLADFQELTTTVEAKLGEWIDLGAILGHRDEVQRAILESAAAESGERRTVRLKIE